MCERSVRVLSDAGESGEFMFRRPSFGDVIPLIDRAIARFELELFRTKPWADGV